VRDEAARRWDRPAFKVFSNETLIAWAKEPPESRAAVLATPAASKATLTGLCEPILEAVARARQLPAEALPQRPPPNPRVIFSAEEDRRLKRLKEARTAVSEKLKLSPGLLVNTATLERLCKETPETLEAALAVALKGWQREAVGAALLAAG
jgi:ribonuclease D